MKNRKMLLQILLAMALVLSLIVPASVVAADENCYAEKAPELIAPAHGEFIDAHCRECGNLPFAIKWDRLCDASRYDIQFAPDYGFESIVEGASETNHLPPEIETPSYFVPAGTLSCDTVYYWRVRVVKTDTGQAIQGMWSEPRSFIVAPTKAPELIAPPDGYIIPADPCGECVNVPFSIAWDRLCDASRYDIQFALDEDFDSIFEGASETDYLPPETETPSY